MALVLFIACAAIAIVFALVVVLHPDPIRSVLSLVVTFTALVVIYVQLSAPLLASLQLIVYTGAILVLFLFVIMLLNVRRVGGEEKRAPLQTLAALVTAGGLGGMIAARMWFFPSVGPQGEATPEALAASGSVRAVAQSLFTRHLFAFEAVSVVLLAALVGALVLTKRERPANDSNDRRETP